MLRVTALIGLRASVVQQIRRAWLTPPGAKPPTAAQPQLRPGSGSCPQAKAGCRQAQQPVGQRAPVLSLTSSSTTLRQGLHPSCSQCTPRAATGMGGIGEGQAVAVLVRERAGAPLARRTLHCEAKLDIPGASQEKQQMNECMQTTTGSGGASVLQ